MSYADERALIDRCGEAELRQIADRDKDGFPDPEVIAAALVDADNTINGYVGVKYKLPLPSVPQNVVTWAVSIARYYLHRNGAPKKVVDDYDHAMSALKDVARGLNALAIAEGEAAPDSASGKVMASHPPKVFTRHKLRGWPR